MADKLRTMIARVAPFLECKPFSEEQIKKVERRIERARVVTEKNVAGLVRTVSEAAMAVYPLSGCGRRDLIDLYASGHLSKGLQLYLGHKHCLSWISEGKKDHAPSLLEGCEFGTTQESERRVLVLSDPVECTGELAREGLARKRASMVLVALAPEGMVPMVESGSRALKICLPPGTPVGSDGIQIDTPPAEVVRILCATFGRAPHQVEATLLNRTWNRGFAEAFRAAGAKVRLVLAGDFEEHLRAAHPVMPGQPLVVSYGIGGLPEGFLAIPFLRWSGAPMLLKRIDIDKQGCVRGCSDEPVYDVFSMIRTNDCVLAVAGITSVEGSAIEGIRYTEETGTLAVTVVVASPLFESCRRFNVSFNKSLRPRLTETHPFAKVAKNGADGPGFGRTAAVLLQRRTSHAATLSARDSAAARIVHFLATHTLETRLTEKGNGEDVETFQHGVPGVLPADEQKLIKLLHDLEDEGILSSSECVRPGDPHEYTLRWSLSACPFSLAG